MGGGATWADQPTLSVWIYDSPRGASAGKVRLERLRQRRAVVVLDAATVMWIKGAHRPRIGRPHARTATAKDRSPLGAFLGRLMFPTEPAVDHVRGLASELRATGLSEAFLRELRGSFVPEASALLVLSLAADFDEVQAAIERGRARGDVRYLHVTLTDAELTALELVAHGRLPDG